MSNASQELIQRVLTERLERLTFYRKENTPAADAIRAALVELGVAA